MQPTKRPQTIQPKSAEAAVAEAMAKGVEVKTTRDADGKELVQRPFSLNDAGSGPQKNADVPMVKVYHNRRTTAYLSDGSKLLPNEQRMIPVEDADNPALAPFLMRLA